MTPQARGAKSPLQEVGIDVSNSAPLLVPPGVDPVGEQVDAGTDTEDTSNSSSCSSSDSESEMVEDEVDGEEDAVAQRPPFLVNRITACFHAVISLNGRCGRACAPRCPVDAPHWELFDTDPVDLEDALVPCFPFCMCQNFGASMSEASSYVGPSAYVAWDVAPFVSCHW